MKVSKYEFIRSPFVTREDTRALKGYAILIMLFLHLFNNKELDCTLEVWFYIKDIPLCYWLTRFATICVSLYMFLSGYGLYIVFKRHSKMNNVRRIMLLWSNVVLVAILFYPLSIAYPNLNWTFDVIGVISTLSGFYLSGGTDNWLNGPIRLLYEIEVVIILILPFLLGAVCAKYGVLKYFQVRDRNPYCLDL